MVNHPNRSKKRPPPTEEIRIFHSGDFRVPYGKIDKMFRRVSGKIRKSRYDYTVIEDELQWLHDELPSVLREVVELTARRIMEAKELIDSETEGEA
jgi:hypothetical protein